MICKVLSFFWLNCCRYVDCRQASDAHERVIDWLQQNGKAAAILPGRNRQTSVFYNRQLYKARHLIENFFCKLKPILGHATRYDKTAKISLWPSLHFASAIILCLLRVHPEALEVMFE